MNSVHCYVAMASLVSVSTYSFSLDQNSGYCLDVAAWMEIPEEGGVANKHWWKIADNDATCESEGLDQITDPGLCEQMGKEFTEIEGKTAAGLTLNNYLDNSNGNASAACFRIDPGFIITDKSEAEIIFTVIDEVVDKNKQAVCTRGSLSYLKKYFNLNATEKEEVSTCYRNVEWAKLTGINSRQAWYAEDNLTNESSFLNFQCSLHNRAGGHYQGDSHHCPMPCTSTLDSCTYHPPVIPPAPVPVTPMPPVPMSEVAVQDWLAGTPGFVTVDAAKDQDVLNVNVPLTAEQEGTDIITGLEESGTESFNSVAKVLGKDASGTQVKLKNPLIVPVPKETPFRLAPPKGSSGGKAMIVAALCIIAAIVAGVLGMVCSSGGKKKSEKKKRGVKKGREVSATTTAVPEPAPVVAPLLSEQPPMAQPVAMLQQPIITTVPVSAPQVVYQQAPVTTLPPVQTYASQVPVYTTATPGPVYTTATPGAGSMVMASPAIVPQVVAEPSASVMVSPAMAPQVVAEPRAVFAAPGGSVMQGGFAAPGGSVMQGGFGGGSVMVQGGGSVAGWPGQPVM